MSSWYYLVGHEQKGPFEEWDLAATFSAGELPPGTLVWKEGLENWIPASSVPALTAAPASAEPEPEPEIYPISLVQKGRLGRTQTFELISDRALRFKSAGKQAQEVVISLKGLKPEPQRVQKRDTRSLVSCIAAVIFAIVLGVLAPFASSRFGAIAAWLLLGVSTVSVGMALFSAYRFYRSLEDNLIFPAYKMSPLTLWYNNPDSATFAAFVALLEKTIARVTEPPEEFEQGPGQYDYSKPQSKG
jgi:hypothetical protein